MPAPCSRSTRPGSRKGTLPSRPAPGAASYPISGYSWALVYTRQKTLAIGQALVTMLDWLTHDGQASAASNGYVPLAAQIQQLARTMLQQVTGPTGTHLLS